MQKTKRKIGARRKTTKQKLWKESGGLECVRFFVCARVEGTLIKTYPRQFFSISPPVTQLPFCPADELYFEAE